MPVLTIIMGILLTIMLSASVAEVVVFKSVVGEAPPLFTTSQPIKQHVLKCNETAASAELKGLLNATNNTSVMSNPIEKKGTVTVRNMHSTSNGSHSAIQSELGCIINQSRVSAAELAKIKEAASHPHPNPPTKTLSPPPKSSTK